MLSLFEDWFLYNHEANAQYIRLIHTLQEPVNQLETLFSHLLNAHLIWLYRILPAQDKLPTPWQAQEKATFATLNNQAYHKTLVLLQRSALDLPFDKQIYYTNSKGEKFCNSIQEIYMQILTHSAYHRGQMALRLREAGIEPPLTDYIFFKRHGL